MGGDVVSGADLLALSPLLVIGATIVVVMLVAAFYRRHAAVMWSCQAGLLLTLAALFITTPFAERQVTPLLIIDGYGLFFSAMILLTTLAVNALAHGYLTRRSPLPEEFYILTPVAALGGMVLVLSHHFATLFMGLELLSIALFGLIAYTSRQFINHQWKPLEAGMKYLILAGVSSAFLVFGMALIYGETGTLEFSHLSNAVANHGARSAYLLSGVALVLTGLAFKLSLVPFHMWVADIYEGAPAPVGAFLATVSKGAVFVVLLRYFPQADLNHAPSLLWALSLIAIASMLAGNLLALLQENLKRLLAYSSVAHLGYLLLLLIAGGDFAVEAAGYYLAAYFVTMLGAFGVITLLANGEQENTSIAEYQGLFRGHPWLATVLTLVLLSLAGIPLTMGFIAKFYILAVGVDRAQWLLVGSLIVASAIGLYYYLRVIITLFQSPEGEVQRPGLFAYSRGGGLVVLATAVLLLLLGIFPAPLMDLLHLPALMLP
jgi:NADH-quinone oxidoreductase subunit N